MSTQSSKNHGAIQCYGNGSKSLNRGIIIIINIIHYYITNSNFHIHAFDDLNFATQ